MKVLHVFKTYLPDSFTGIERVIWEIAEGQAGLGIQSDVLYLNQTGSDQPIEIDKHWGHPIRRQFEIASTPMSFGLLRRFQRLAKQADIIHYHFPWPVMDILHRWSGIRKPAIVTYHSDIIKQKRLMHIYKPVMEKFLSSVDIIVATSDKYLESSHVLRKYREKTVVIPIGISEKSIIDTDKLGRWKKRLPEKFFLFVGANRYYKGFSFLLDASRKTGFPVVVVGGGFEALEKECPTNVILLGKLDDEDKTAVLSLCYAYVFPSHLRSEAFGIALLEAAFQGKPLISCEIETGTSYINLHNLTGIVIPPANAPALADAMRKLWTDEDLAANFGHNANERAHELFTARDMAGAYENIYKSLLENYATPIVKTSSI